MQRRKEGFKAVQNLYAKSPAEKESKLDTKSFRGNGGKKKGRVGRKKGRSGGEYLRPQSPFTGEIQRFINQL